ncbi:MAG: sialate O-acetylesterase [Terrimonas sp.]|nr:sialate O-acetylesterase [Terrimonas sp.]
MVKNYYFFLMLLLLQQVTMAQGEILETDRVPAQMPHELDIYLVIGQSNMSGRARIREEDSAVIHHAFLFTGNEKTPWVMATNPLNRYSSVRKELKMQKLGPAYAFAESMVANRKGNEIGLVVNARGGTQIVQWLPGTTLYREAVRQTQKALQYGKLKGVIWHQGEGDCDSIRVGLYLGRLEMIINGIRETFDDPNLPFIAGQLFETDERHGFNQMILQLPGFIQHTGVALSTGTRTMEGTHFDSESAMLLGQRYAGEMKKIQGLLKK